MPYEPTSPYTNTPISRQALYRHAYKLISLLLILSTNLTSPYTNTPVTPIINRYITTLVLISTVLIW
jgi:hypothetical protein